jgi:PST family polysaccharide transporter
MSVLFPKLSRLLAEQSLLGSDYVLSLVKNALIAAGLGSLLIWLFAPGLIPLLFGSDFSPAAHILRILSPALPLVFLNTVFFYVFAAARRRFVCLGTLGLGLAAGTLLSAYLTSQYGATGTATADVAREFAMSAVYLGFLIQGNHSRHAGLALLKVFLGATALLALTVLLVSPFQIQVTWLVAWLLFVLMGALAALGLPTIAEWRLLTDDRV